MESPYLTQHRAWEQLEFTVNDIPRVSLSKSRNVEYLVSLPFWVLSSLKKKLSTEMRNTNNTLCSLSLMHWTLFLSLHSSQSLTSNLLTVPLLARSNLGQVTTACLNASGNWGSFAVCKGDNNVFKGTVRHFGKSAFFSLFSAELLEKIDATVMLCKCEAGASRGLAHNETTN